MSWAGRVDFEAFCNFCEKVVKEPKKDKRLMKLTSFLGHCRDYARESASTSGGANNAPPESLFPVIRFLLPALDRERGAYGIKVSCRFENECVPSALGRNYNGLWLLKNIYLIFFLPSGNCSGQVVY